ncbi:hypothetical protein GCM10007989_13190 [Devosia pacifica]|uniref:Uncharacterized protein n=1 Tax=Devosia pacifica TaxID=1335967 RepID=A0A918S3L5_9HYPH|nr:hypothetical protein GCM10007989_13190 [Devosia pacifica]
MLILGQIAVEQGAADPLLADAEMVGLSSQGLSLPRIVEQIAIGVACPSNAEHRPCEAPGFARVDGREGLGSRGAPEALEEVALRAQDLGAVDVFNLEFHSYRRTRFHA